MEKWLVRQSVVHVRVNLWHGVAHSLLRHAFISFHFISFHFISFHFISFHFISFHFISFHFISFHFISFHFISFHFISFHFISFHFISFHFISFHFISFHFISFHFISFHFISFICGAARSVCALWCMSFLFLAGGAQARLGPLAEAGKVPHLNPKGRHVPITKRPHAPTHHLPHSH